METSESIKNISKALLQFQKEVKNPANTAYNPFHKSKYAPLNEILNDVRPLLGKNGLSVIQSPGGDGNNVEVTTFLLHESGEWIKSDPLVLRADKATAQGAGSAITYARRYALTAMLGISSEDDDDGNVASGKRLQDEQQPAPAKPETQKPATNEKPRQTTTGGATPNQLKKLHAVSKEAGIPADDMKQIMMAKYGKESSKELTKAEVSDLIDYLVSIPGSAAV